MPIQLTLLCVTVFLDPDYNAQQLKVAVCRSQDLKPVAL